MKNVGFLDFSLDKQLLNNFEFGTLYSVIGNYSAVGDSM